MHTFVQIAFPSKLFNCGEFTIEMQHKVKK